MTPSEKAQTYNQILKKYLDLRKKSNTPFGGGRSFNEANELWGDLPPLPKDIQHQAYQLLRRFFKMPQSTVNRQLELVSEGIPQRGSNINALLEAYINKDDLRTLLPGYDVFEHALKFSPPKKT